MNRTLTTIVVIACVALNACSAARSTAVDGQYVPRAQITRDNPDAHDRPVLMLKTGLPKDVKIEVLGEVMSNNKFYGSIDRVMEDIAYKARLIGADAVININVKYRMTALAWSAGSAAGVAVKITDKGDVDLNSLPGASWK